MKLFLDTANFEQIRWANDLGVLDGVTTNPTLVAKENRNFKEAVMEICELVKGPVSAEVVSLDSEGMLREARLVASWAPNIVVKVPLTPDGLKTVSQLKREGIKTNVTLVFSAPQGLLAAKAGASYVSPFVGRLDDVGHDGMQVVRDLRQIFGNYGFTTEIIAASIRHPLHVVEAAKAGAHIATLPWAVLEAMMKHPLTDRGIERFLADWKSLPSSSQAFK